jgi:hypothetical protein
MPNVFSRSNQQGLEVVVSEAKLKSMIDVYNQVLVPTHGLPAYNTGNNGQDIVANLSLKTLTGADVATGSLTSVNTTSPLQYSGTRGGNVFARSGITVLTNAKRSVTLPTVQIAKFEQRVCGTSPSEISSYGGGTLTMTPYVGKIRGCIDQLMQTEDPAQIISELMVGLEEKKGVLYDSIMARAITSNASVLSSADPGSTVIAKTHIAMSRMLRLRKYGPMGFYLNTEGYSALIVEQNQFGDFITDHNLPRFKENQNANFETGGLIGTFHNVPVYLVVGESDEGILNTYTSNTTTNFGGAVTAQTGGTYTAIIGAVKSRLFIGRIPERDERVVQDTGQTPWTFDTGEFYLGMQTHAGAALNVPTQAQYVLVPAN